MDGYCGEDGGSKGEICEEGGREKVTEVREIRVKGNNEKQQKGETVGIKNVIDKKKREKRA